MIRLGLSAILAIGVLVGCAAPDVPTQTAPGTLGPSLCQGVPASTCDAVVEAAELMAGGSAVELEALPLPTDDGTPMAERYLVRVEVADGSSGGQLVEVVRFSGNDHWSARRVDRPPD